MTMTATEITYYLTGDARKSILTGALTLPVIGIGFKEIVWDKLLGRGVCSVKDMLYDAWGTLIGVIVEVCWIDWRKTKDYERKVKSDYRKHIFE